MAIKTYTDRPKIKSYQCPHCKAEWTVHANRWFSLTATCHQCDAKLRGRAASLVDWVKADRPSVDKWNIIDTGIS